VIHVLEIMAIIIGALIILGLAARLLASLLAVNVINDTRKELRKQQSSMRRDPGMQEYLKRESIDGTAWWNQP
jgi:hypothetical protein